MAPEGQKFFAESAVGLSRASDTRTLSEPFSHRIVHLRHGLGLLPNRDADVTDIVAVVIGSKRNRMFPVTRDRKINRVPLSLAVGNSVVGKDLMPGAAIHADVRAFDASRGVLDIEHRAGQVAGNLRRHRHANNRRRIVYVYRFTDPLG